MIEVLQKLEIDEMHHNMVKTVYNKPIAYLIVYGGKIQDHDL